MMKLRNFKEGGFLAVEQFTRVGICGSVLLVGISLGITRVHAHQPGKRGVSPKTPKAAATRATPASPTAVSGQGTMRFKVLYTSDHLPQEAVKVLKKAHGGFAIDRRQGRGETYFALPGGGIIQISSDLKSTRMINTPANVKKVNLHNTTIWYGSDGTAYLTFPAESAGKVFTTTLEGNLIHTLDAPSGEENFDNATVNNYFYGKGHFAPTDVEQLGGLFYVTTGYSSLDYVLTAKIASLNPFKAAWYDLVFGGKGDAPGQFGTAHGITVPPGEKRLDIADRPKAEIDRFTRYGHYRSTLNLPRGSFPCDIDYLEKYAIVGCLHGPDRSKGAPAYILGGDKLISTVMPKEELGLENFTHIHNAVLRKIGSKFYIILQAWNPGDFAILEQVSQ